jgi:hypothetical protein
MATAFFVVAAYIGVALVTWNFLTRPLLIATWGDRLYCFVVSLFWPMIPGAILFLILAGRPRRIS